MKSLRAELDQANVVPASNVPLDVTTMNSTAQLRDLEDCNQILEIALHGILRHDDALAAIEAAHQGRYFLLSVKKRLDFSHYHVALSVR